MKKNKKQRFISDKISELQKEGKSQQQSLAIALSMANESFQNGGFKTPPTIDFNASDLPDYYKSTVVKNPNTIPTETIDGVTYEISRLGTLHPVGSLEATEFGAVKKGAPILKTDRSTLQTIEIAENKIDPNRNVKSIFDLNKGWIVDEEGKRKKKVEIGDYSKYYEDGGNHIAQYQFGGSNTPFFNNSKNYFQYTPQSSTPGNEQWYKPNLEQPSLRTPSFNSQTSNIIQNQPTPTSFDLEDNTWLDEQKDKERQDEIQANKATLNQNSQLTENNIINTQKPPIQFANPYGGVDLNQASALFGQSLQQGDALMGVASGAKLGLGLARNFMSGYSASKDRNRVLNDYSSNMRNTMTGAETPVQFQEGGEVNSQDQLVQQVMVMLQQGVSPEQIMQELVAMGIPEQEVMQVIQMVMQQSEAPQQEQMMQEGGVAIQPEVSVEMANAEIEDGEYVQDTEGVKYAEGAKHSEGGIPTQLENGARVLSDYKKVGKDLSKQFSEQLGFEIKASDTFATVLDKFNKKEGFDKKIEHLNRYSDKLDKQEKTVKHDATLALNKQILMEEAQEDTKKLQELVKQQEGLFNILFEAQEAKKVMKEGGNYMQNGGTVTDLMTKYNISEEEAMKLIPSMQNGETYNVPEPVDRGNIYSPTNPNNPLFAGQIPQILPSNRVANTFEQDFYGYQKPNRDWKDFGNLNKEQQAEVLKDIARVFPSLAQKFLKDGAPSNPAEFQLAINNHYDNLKKDAEKQYPKGSKEYKDFVASVDKERFTIPTDIRNIKGLVTDIDAKFGDFTSTRPNFAFDVLPQDVLTEVKNAGVNTASELKEAFPNYYDKYVKPKNLESDFWLGKVAEQAQSSTPITSLTETPMELPTTPVVDVTQDKNRMAFLNLPDQTPMLPWAMQAPAMLRQTIYAPRWNEISPEQQLTDIQRGRVATAEQMSFLPDSQQASSLFALDANAMVAQNKVRSETERYNQMARERTEATEADQKTRQSAADVVAAQTYQQQLGNELEANEADWRSWYNRVQSNQMNNWDSIERANLYNAYNPNVQRTSNGYEVINEPTFTNDASKKYLAEQEKKTKKKNPVGEDGGTFRGKKSTKRFGK